MRAELAALGPVDTLTVSTYSRGGDTFEALSTYDALLRHSARYCIVENSFVAASAGSIIAMFGIEIRMVPAALMMLHMPTSFMVGRAEAMRREADRLDQIADNLTNICAHRITSHRTGRTAVEIRDWMESEIWFHAVTACDVGLCDTLLQAA